MSTRLTSTSHVARLVAMSREAQRQSAQAIRQSLVLLRDPIYPGQCVAASLRLEQGQASPAGAKKGKGDPDALQGHHRNRGIGR